MLEPSKTWDLIEIPTAAWLRIALEVFFPQRFVFGGIQELFLEFLVFTNRNLIAFFAVQGL